jgi:ATP-dependent RNA helicase DOB1
LLLTHIQPSQHAKALAALEAQADAVEVAGEESVAEFERLKAEIAAAGAIMLAETLRPERCLRFMRPGRLVRVRVAGADYGWGVVCAVIRKAAAAPPADAAAAAAAAPDAAALYVLDTLLRVLPPLAPGAPPRPSPDGAAGELGVLPVALSCVSAISALMVQLPEDLRAPEARAAVGLALAELHRRFPAGLPRLDPIQDMGIEEPRFVAAARAVEALEPRLLAHPLFAPSAEAKRYGVGGGGRDGGSGSGSGAGADGAARMAAYERKAALKAEAAALRAKMRASTLTRFREELHSRSAVLKRLGHIDAAGIVQLKGRAACEIDTGDELLITELMFAGAFSGMTPAVCAALCSCFVPTEKSKGGAPLRPELNAALLVLHETAARVAEVQARGAARLRAEGARARVRAHC